MKSQRKSIPSRHNNHVHLFVFQRFHLIERLGTIELGLAESDAANGDVNERVTVLFEILLELLLGEDHELKITCF